jgi:hypothetical protein
MGLYEQNRTLVIDTKVLTKRKGNQGTFNLELRIRCGCSSLPYLLMSSLEGETEEKGEHSSQHNKFAMSDV